MKNRHVALVGFCVGFSVVCFIWGVLWMVMCLDYKDQVNKLQQENKELQNKIDKAIEYIEKCSLGEDYYGNPVMLAKEDEGKDLLEMLKGDSGVDE